MAGPVEDELKRLNRELFAAENKQQSTWEDFFQRTLSPDFTIKRADGSVQNKGEMIEKVRGDARKRNEPTDDSAWVGGDYGIVTSVVTLRDDNTGNKYQNLKLFQRSRSSRWQCLYWRVTKLTRK